MSSRWPEIGELSQIVLKTNGTYHTATYVACIVAPCNPVEANGRYKLFRRGTMHYIDLFGPDEALSGRYEVQLRGDNLNLRSLLGDWLPGAFGASRGRDRGRVSADSDPRPRAPRADLCFARARASGASRRAQARAIPFPLPNPA